MAGIGDLVGVFHRSPDEEDRADKSLSRQIRAASCSKALIVMGHFTFSVGEGTQQAISSLSCSWDVLVINSFSK